MHVKEKFLNEFIDAFRKKVEHIINKYKDDFNEKKEEGNNLFRNSCILLEENEIDII